MLTPMHIPIETKTPLEGILPGKLSQNYYNNVENEHSTFQVFIIRDRHVVVYNKYGI